MPSQAAHVRANTVMEGLMIDHEYRRIEEPDRRKGWSISRLVWDITIGILAATGTALGGAALGLALRKTGSSSVPEPYGLSGLVPNNTEFGEAAFSLMPHPYLYGTHGPGNASFTAGISQGSALCRLVVPEADPVPFNASSPPASVLKKVGNPTEFSDTARGVQVKCTGDQPALLFARADFNGTDGKSVRQNTEIRFNPA